MLSIPARRFAFFGLLASTVPFLFLCRALTQQVQYSSAHRNGEHVLPQTLAGGTAQLRSQLGAARKAISLAVADFDRDGTSDLVTGYATSNGGALTLQRGSAEALSPSPSDWPDIARGQIVPPFASTTTVVALPVRPDFLKAVDLNGNGTMDVVVAARGDSSVYVLKGDGAGNFAAPRALPAGGTVTALTIWPGPEGTSFVVAGVCTATCGLQVLAADGSVRASIALPAAASVIETAPLNGGAFSDLAVVADGKVLLVDGDSVASGAPRTETLPIGGATALAGGNFVYDRRGFRQLAVLGSDATLHILTRNGIDTSAPTLADVQANRAAMRHGIASQTARVSPSGIPWTEPETLFNVGPGFVSAPVMFRARLSGGGYDDLAVLAGGQFVTVAHPATFQNGTGSTTPVVIVDSTANVVSAAIPVRINADARQGVVFADRTAQPRISLLPTNKTFTVTTATDGVHIGTTCTSGAACTIRDAVALANKDVGTNGLTKVDTINVPAGTYQFTTAYHPANDSGGNINYHYDLDASINIVGAGSGSTILNASNLDKIFSGDSGVVNPLAPYDVFITGMTIENGTNDNNPNTASNFYGGIMDWESYGPGNLTFNNVIMTGGTAPYSGGGGLFSSNSADLNTTASEGLVEFDNSTVSSNSSPEQGGGIYLGSGCPALFNTVAFTGNKALTSISGSFGADPAKDGSGGAIYSFGSQATGLNTITNSTFTSNAATDSGGAIVVSGGMSISGSTFTGNSAAAFGGALYFIGGTAAGTITSSTFTGNSLSGSSGQTYGGVYQVDGGAICNQSYGTTSGSQFGNLTMHYSRIHGNTGGHATGLAIGCSSGANQYATVNATDNWWGCNGAGTSTGCDTAIAASPSTQALTLTPFSKLNITLSSASPAGGNSFTATGSLGQDSSGTLYTSPQNAALAGVPATLAIVQNGGGTTNSGASVLDTSASIATTATASAAGAGTATVTVDGTAVSASFSVVVADMTLTSAHTGSFIAGSTGNVYTLTATNNGNSPTTAAVTVVDSLPVGFTATALSGSGWNCTLATLTCTNPNLIAASTAFLPITLTVTAGSTVGSFNNTANVSGGGEFNVSNDSYTDTTVVVAGSVAGFKVTGLSASTAPGTPGNVTVTAVDAFTNTVTGFTGTVTITSTDGSATLPAPYTYVSGDNGVHTFSVTLATAGTWSVTATSGTFTGSEIGIVVADSIWFINANGTLDRLTDAGVQSLPLGSAGTASTRAGLAFDNTGAVWSVSNSTNSVVAYSRTGIPLSVPGNAAAGVNTPAALALDGLARIWVANGNNSVSVLNSSGAAITPSTGYKGGAISTPSAMMVDSSGSVWITNSGNNSVTKIMGGAAPVTTPTVTGTTNNTLATRP
jgi:trimeric autotransporter adhesin